MAEPKGVITPAEAKVLDAAYDARHTLISQSILKMPDNRSSWFSLEDLEWFIENAKSKYPDMDGVRIYQGAYPAEGGQAGYTTVFMVPTAPDSLGKDGKGGSGDIDGADGLNLGQSGNPPSANYPQ